MLYIDVTIGIFTVLFFIWLGISLATKKELGFGLFIQFCVELFCNIFIYGIWYLIKGFFRIILHIFD